MDRWKTRLLTLLLALVYLLPFPYLQAINNPNENTRTYLVMALVDDHTWALDGVVARYGWTNDMASVPDATAPGGAHLAAVKGPATAYLGVPIYVMHRLVMSAMGKAPPAADAPIAVRREWLRTTSLVLEMFCAHLPGLVFLIWMERRLRVWSSDAVLRLSAVVTVGVGTNFLAYSLAFVSHALIGAAAFVALDTLGRERSRSFADLSLARLSSALLAGLATGMLTLLEYPALFVSALVGSYAMWVLRSWRARGAFAIGAAACAALLMLFQWASFGNPLTPGHRMMQTQEFKALSEKGFFTLGTPDVGAASALLFDRTFGLLTTAPFLSFSLLGLGVALISRRSSGRWMARRASVIVAVASVGVLVLAVSASAIWRGGWTIGPRYLGLAPPVLAMAALFGLETLSTTPVRRALARALATATTVASFVQLGLVSLVVTTLPEAIERPVVQMFVPMIRLDFLPHHLLEAVGVTASWPWWIALIAACGAVMLVVVMRTSREPTPQWAGRVLGSLVIAGLLLRPSLSLPRGHADQGPESRAIFAAAWEPAGRDAITRARERAASAPCAWNDVATLERRLGRGNEAVKAERNARARGCAP